MSERGEPRKGPRARRRRVPGERSERDARPAFVPRASFEELEIHTSDGVALRAVVDDPPEGTPLRGTCVLAHAMFARSSEFGRRDRPGLAHALTLEGFRTIAFDFRGHGASTSPAPATVDWGYDDLVRFDLPAVVSCARDRAEGKPVLVVGHSLGGHVALAAQGTGRIDVDGVVGIAANVWLRELEPSRIRWAMKLGIAHGLRRMADKLGRLPARRLRFGSDDASARYVRDLLRSPLEGRWTSADGNDDYLAALARVTVPVLAIASAGDHVNCPPASAEAFARRCTASHVRFLEITRADDGGPPPDHMALVTSSRSRRQILTAISELLAARD